MNDVTGASPGASGPGASTTPAGDGASSGAIAADAAAATGSPSEGAAAASETPVSTGAGESATRESTPSLLSSAAGKNPDAPAPAAEPSTEAKPADPAVKDGASAEKKPEDPAKAEVKADAATDPATKDATAKDPAKDQPPAPLSIDDLKLPDGASLDAEASKAFVDTLNNAELSGKDRGQALIDLHTKEITRVADEMSKHQRKVWDDLNAGWKDQLRKDPELGGNRLNTSLSMAKAVVEEFLSPEDAKALLVHTDNNGMGNFPVFVRLLHSIGKRMNVFEDGVVVSNPSQTPPKGPGKRGWYNNTPTMNGSAP